jgi:hypothetical protein
MVELSVFVAVIESLSKSIIKMMQQVRDTPDTRYCRNLVG